MRILEEALTFDDVLLVPAYSEILPREVDLSTHVTRRIRLNVPLMSAAMDTVTEARLAITIAQEGGIGIIHKNMTIDAQAREVGRVKKFESGVIKDPITVSPDMTHPRGARPHPLARHLRRAGGGGQEGGGHRHPPRPAVRRQARCAGLRGDDSRRSAWSRCARTRRRKKCWSCCTSHRIEKVLVVNRDQRAGRHDHGEGLPEGHGISRAPARTNAAGCASGAAVGTTPDTLERVAALREAGVDVVVVDTAHGHSKGVIDTVSAHQGEVGRRRR